MQAGSERYAEWKEIGQGATATVYKTMDQYLGRLVAIKIIKESVRSNPLVMDSLKQEVIISRELRHPNICPIHDFYDGPMGVGVVMDLINGIELRKWLDKNKGRLLDTAEARLNLFKKLMEALVVAHTKIVHRDLKPDNIFLVDGDPMRPVIMDFGVANLGKACEDGSMIAGTPKYMSPEQWEAPHKVDGRSDLFSMGILGYEIFTDRIPPTTLKDILKTRMPSKVPLHMIEPPSRFCLAVPVSLDNLILKMMAYEQPDRPQTAREVVEALQHVQVNADIAAILSKETGNEGKTALGERGGISRDQQDTVATARIPGGLVFLGGKGEMAMPNEKPIRKLEISPFRMALHLVTNRDYRRFIENTGYTPPPLMNDSVFGRANHPVVAVTLADVLAYANWAGGMLPTEAQWECAAKGGRKFSQYPWGDEDPTSLRANIDWVSEATTPVGSCPAGRSEQGILDLCGNVWEWCLDWYAPDYYGILTDGTRDPINTNKGTTRVLRGGSFDSSRQQGRCSFRFYADPNSRSKSIGFRLIYPA